MVDRCQGPGIQEIEPPSMCPKCRQILGVIGLRGPWHVSPRSVAEACGMASRGELARHLARHGLPPFSTLRAWLRVVDLVRSWDASACSVMRNCWAHGRDPSIGYRTVRRVTGLSWLRVRTDGFDKLVSSFQHQLATTVHCDNAAAPQAPPPNA